MTHRVLCVPLLGGLLSLAGCGWIAAGLIVSQGSGGGNATPAVALQDVTNGRSVARLVALVPHAASTYGFEFSVTDVDGLTSFPQYFEVPVVPAGNPAAGPPQVRLAALGGAATGIARAGARTAAPAATTRTVAPAATASAAASEVTLVGTVGQPVEISAGESRSRNGGDLTFQWRQRSGTPTAWLADGAGNFQFTPAVEDAYEFELTVTDATAPAPWRRWARRA